MAHVQDRWEAEGRASGGKRWRVRWRTASGATRSKSFERKSDAERFRAHLEVDLSNGSYVDKSRGKTTFGEFAEVWFSIHEPLVKPKTAKGYRGLLNSRLLPRWESVSLSSITHREVAEWYAEMIREPLSASRVRQAHVLLAQILDYAVADKRLTENPIRNSREKIRLPKVKAQRRHVYLSHEQVRELADAIDPRFEAVVLTLAYCGLRWSELVGLNVEHVDANAKRINVDRALVSVSGRLEETTPKNHQARSVPIPDFILDLLEPRLRLDAEAILFPAPEGGRLFNENFRKNFWQPALKRADLKPMRIHELRHTCASLAVQAGASVPVVAKMLGHDARETLKTYADLFERDLDDVAVRLQNGARRAEQGLRVVSIDPARKVALRSS